MVEHYRSRLATDPETTPVLSPLDDFPLHQTSRPIAVPAATDRNAYGRYWFGAFERTGAFQVEAAFGRYPNLRVTDCSVSISR
ncbi:MAG: hypothetical protein OES57_19255, partial [Acidimicrobiia bacterium]|nr:hypothetical protein [Acidimicrobiia bacterium]